MEAAQRAILAANLKRVRERIAAACARASRDAREVTLIAVTKTVSAEITEALIELGVTDIGENKFQAAKEKFPQVPALRERARIRRHFIGHLQSNKVKGVLELFDVIHSVDSLKLAEEIDKRALALRRGPVPCFIEVNSGEEQKQGVSHEQAWNLWLDCQRLGGVQLCGLMTMAPLKAGPAQTRSIFSKLAVTRDDVRAHENENQARHLGLSMGMSNDFEIAVEEGATHVRIGTALFEGLNVA